MLKISPQRLHESFFLFPERLRLRPGHLQLSLSLPHRLSVRVRHSLKGSAGAQLLAEFADHFLQGIEDGLNIDKKDFYDFLNLNDLNKMN